MTDNEIQPVAIKIDSSTLAMSSHGSITGLIALCEANRCFPSVNWSDFPVVILGWWLEPVPHIIQGKTKIWKCRFMDGPLLLELVQRKDDIWSMTGSHNSTVKFNATISCQAFVRNLLCSAREVLNACHCRGWHTRDIEALATNLKRGEF